MKKTSTWLVILLTFITFGLYAIYWAAQNREYIAEHTKSGKKLPKWLWLIVIPAGMGVAFVGMVVFAILAMFGAVSIDAGLIGINVMTALIILLPTVIGLWWLWYFGAEIEKMTQGRMRRNWTLLLYVMVGPFVIAFHQFYINRLDENEKGETYESSFGLLAIISVLFLMFVWSSTSTVTSLIVSNEANREALQSAHAEYEAALEEGLSQ